MKAARASCWPPSSATAPSWTRHMVRRLGAQRAGRPGCCRPTATSTSCAARCRSRNALPLCPTAATVAATVAATLSGTGLQSQAMLACIRPRGLCQRTLCRLRPRSLRPARSLALARSSNAFSGGGPADGGCVGCIASRADTPAAACRGSMATRGCHAALPKFALARCLCQVAATWR